MAIGSTEQGSVKMGGPVLLCVSPYKITPKKQQNLAKGRNGGIIMSTLKGCKTKQAVKD